MKNAFYNVLFLLPLFVSIMNRNDASLIYPFVASSEISSTSTPNRADLLRGDLGDTKGNNRRRLSLSELNGPFRMNEVAKEKAATNQEIIHEGCESCSAIETPESTRRMSQTKNQTNTATSLQNAIVSPMRERLLTDEGTEDRNETSSTLSSSEKSRQEFAKLWWVNLWIQQIPSNEKEGGPYNDTSNQTAVINESIEEEQVESVPIHEEVTRNELLVEQTGDINNTQSIEVELSNISDSATELLRSENVLAGPTPESNPGIVDAREFEDAAFVSSGMWVFIDNALTFGLASKHRKLRVSRRLRYTRKLFARITGFHGLISGKGYYETTDFDPSRQFNSEEAVSTATHDTGLPKGNDDAMKNSREKSDSESEDIRENLTNKDKLRESAELEEEKRILERVKNIDRLIAEGQERLQQLICEKDVLQCRPNPLFDYATQSTSSDSTGGGEEGSSRFSQTASRQFKFPPDDLVDEYLEMIFWSRRLMKMNHTYLWKDTDLQEDDERIGEDLLAPPVSRLSEVHKQGSSKNGRGRTKNGGGGSWLLRQSIGKGPSLGEKLGETVEKATYKAVASAVMSSLARALSSLHGINVMKHSDIRLMLEHSPDLPPMDIAPTSYAHDALKTVFRTKARHRKKRHKQRSSDRAFIQKDAVTEMLLSQVQISAPLLKSFPQAWQRALLGNIITLSTAVISDFFDGLQFQILGYRLSFSFKPITQEDMINHLGFTGIGFNNRRGKLPDFEAAVKATAQDIGEELKFLDRWHERALGSGILRTQIANLIARVVLTLIDEVLSGARMDLWSAHAGGPRIMAGLEYRMQTN